MAAWHRSHNISGTVHILDRLEVWLQVARSVLETENVGPIGHTTGAISVVASSPIADLVSSGFEVHDYWVLVPGELAPRQAFVDHLEAALLGHNLSYSLTVHETVQMLP